MLFWPLALDSARTPYSVRHTRFCRSAKWDQVATWLLHCNRT